jgi:hypothetical protein
MMHGTMDIKLKDLFSIEINPISLNIHFALLCKCSVYVTELSLFVLISVQNTQIHCDGVSKMFVV